MDMPPIVSELIDKPRRVLWLFRARRPITEAEQQAAIAEYLRDKGDPAPNKQIDVLMKELPPG